MRFNLISAALIFFVAIAVYLLNDILAPFIIAFMMAYILEPITKQFENIKYLPRQFVSILILIVITIAIVIFFIVIIPFLYEQITLFIKKVPYYNEYLTKTFVPTITDKLEEIYPSSREKIQLYVKNLTDQLTDYVFIILTNIWHYTLSTIHFITNLVLVPILTYYFVKDWKQGKHFIISLIPVNYRKTVLLLVRDINIVLVNFIRGQLNVCFILSVYYTIILLSLDVDFALLIGVISGFIIIIPYLGFFISLIFALFMSYLSAHNFNVTMLVGLSYLIGHLIENYVLVPRFIGNNIGLHPLVIIFAIILFGNLGGLAGVIFAIPLTGIIKILSSALLKNYKKSNFYLGFESK